MNRYGSLALRYAQTYLPSQVAQLSDPQQHYSDLGDEVAQEVDRLTEEMLPGVGDRTLSAPERIQETRAARKQAEEQVLAEMVLLPPEPGTESRELPSQTPLPGWSDPLPETPDLSTPASSGAPL